MANEKDQSKEKSQWHLDKTFSISHIITTASAIGAAFIFASKLDTRVTLLEQSDATRQREVSEVKAAFREELRDINAKLDRLIERSK